MDEQIAREQVGNQLYKIEMAMKLLELANGDGRKMMEEISVQCACAMAVSALSYIAVGLASVAETGGHPKQIAADMMPSLISKLQAELATYQDGERDAVPSEQDTQDTPEGA